MNFNIPLFLTPLNSGPNEPTVIGTYESNKKAVPVNGLQDYDALIWIEDGEEWVSFVIYFIVYFILENLQTLVQSLILSAC